MCGIAGVHYKNSQVSEKHIKTMLETMQHRGPDFSGLHLSGDRKSGIGHNRLSIIDLSSSANQPMCNEDGTQWLVFNGEIYNFVELRNYLLKRNHKFKSYGDSEVILHLYEEKGINLLEDLNGMFAFCLFSEDEHRFFLARDRIGIKPLYYYFKNGRFAFSSELKALLSLPFISRNIDFEALNYYFALGYIPEDLSIFEDIKKLKPGHYLSLNENNFSIVQYWDLLKKKQQLSTYCESELIDLLEEKLRDSISLRKVSDVPVGSFLSGGLDSSLVSTLMAQESRDPIATFTIGFDSARYNEIPYARPVADYIKSKHTEYYVQIDAIYALEKLIEYFDEPFADSSLIPTFFVSKLAKKHVTVILSGDGGDELFGGYNWYSWVLFLNKLKNIMGQSTDYISRFAYFLPKNFRGKNFLSKLNLSPAEQYMERISIFNSFESGKLYSNEFKQNLDLDAIKNKFIKRFNKIDGNLVDKMTLTDFHLYLPEDILTKVDRASMAVSLEVRVPWLDHRMVEFAFSLPSQLKINGSKKKYLTKQLAKKLFSFHFSLERKHGFNLPVDFWMKGQLGNFLENQLRTKPFPGYINLDYVESLLYEQRKSKRANYGAKLFSVLFFIMWYKKYLWGK